jgi:hypothetical protein
MPQSIEMPIPKSIPKVMGRNMERAATEVSPGKAPKIIPTNTPKKTIKKFMGFVRMAAKPPSNSIITITSYNPNNPRGKNIDSTLVNNKYRPTGIVIEKHTIKAAHFLRFSAGIKTKICIIRKKTDDRIKPRRVKQYIYAQVSNIVISISSTGFVSRNFIPAALPTCEEL